jgi:hypothetical protein
MRRRRRQHRADRDRGGGLAHHGAIGGHQAGRDRGLRAGTAFEQAAVDQQPIGAKTGAHRAGLEHFLEKLAIFTTCASGNH